MDKIEKLEILADAAKYDVSCASSGAGKRAARKGEAGGRGFGSTEGMGICHSYTPDGRCISLLKILLTNFCLYECSYCINRNSSNVRRARFSVEEVVDLTCNFYRRNYIEGLFLSSGIIQSADYTMEQMVEVARRLREEEGFRGYIHLKTIPEADERLIEQAGRYADRLSINVELPQAASLKVLAPEKSATVIQDAMGTIKRCRTESVEENRDRSRHAGSRRVPQRRFTPAGQSTQMIVGADDSSDRLIIARSAILYRQFDLKRVYYSAFSPIPDSSNALPSRRPPLQRENRLYQADWLMRFYQFNPDEILGPEQTQLDLEIDPKLAWALANRSHFPVDLNRCSRRELLRVPGIGPGSVARILQARRFRRIRLDDLKPLRLQLKRVRPFILTIDHHPGALLEDPLLRSHLIGGPVQTDLFG